MTPEDARSPSAASMSSDSNDLRGRLDALREHLKGLHRYTITSEGASKGYFRLVEDPEGAWAQWPEIETVAGDLAAVLASQQEEEPKDDEKALEAAQMASNGSLGYFLFTGRVEWLTNSDVSQEPVYAAEGP